jgi:predicted ATPase/class 3 adenylate cyclase
MTNRPTGTVTFLFTDIEGSTRLWELYPRAMQAALARHDTLLRQAIEAHGGYVFKTVGDAFCAAFPSAPQGLEAALVAQMGLRDEPWGATGEIRVRMGLHTGVTEEREGDYVGPLLNRVSRLMSATHGGQVLVSMATYSLLPDVLSGGVTLRDLGEHHLRDLQRAEHIYQVVAPGLPADFPPLKTLDNRPNNLPLQRSPLIGREKETASISSELLRDEVGLLTLTGPGGVGKTRLALQVAADVIDHFPDGVFFVALEPISDIDLVPSSVAHVLGVRESAGQSLVESLKEYTRGKKLLLVMDNFEQLTGAARFLADLLAAAPELKALVTSREVLRLYNEHEFQVPPLGMPDPSLLPSAADLVRYEAVRLFVDRARVAKADFSLTAQNARPVAEICFRLDGLPLAIELAAARVKILPPQAILDRLVGARHASPLQLLTGGARDLPARQQTLRNTIAWSYDLLQPGEKILYRRMSVFVGGCSLEAVEEVCGGRGPESGAVPGAQILDIDLLDGVTSLTDKSLLRQDERSEGEPCFVMLETIREFGLERLVESGEQEAIRRQHAEFFLKLAEQAEPQLQGPQQGTWLGKLETEHDNLRAALGWGLERGDGDLALRLCVAAWGFWFLHGHLSEGRRLLEGALAAAPRLPTSNRARALYALGRFVHTQGEYAEARRLYQESLTIYGELGDKQGIARTLSILGQAAHDEGDFAMARSLYDESLGIFRELGDRSGIAGSLFRLAIAAEAVDDHASQQSLLEEGLVLFRELGNKQGIASSLNSLGELARRRGDYDSARAHYEESLSIFQELKHKWGTANALHNLGCVAREQGHHSQAASLFGDSMALYRQLGNRKGVVDCLAALAGLAAAQGRWERAASLFGASAALLAEMSANLEPADRAESDRDLEATRGQMDAPAFAAAWSAGHILSLDEAVELALK